MCLLVLLLSWMLYNDFSILYLKGMVRTAEPCECDINLISRILWHKRITPSFLLKNGDFNIWYSPTTFHHNLSLKVYAAPFQWRLLVLIGKNLWCWVLEANKKQVPLKSFSLKIWIDSVNKDLKNKEKVT